MTQMLNDVSLHTETNEEEHIKIMSVTWNMQGGCPDADYLDEVFQMNSVRHDMYVFASQEAVRPIATSMMMPSKEKLNQKVMEYFATAKSLDDGDKHDNEYILVNSISLAATHLMIMIRKTLVPYLSDIKYDELACGTGDMLSNKNGVCISFRLGSIRMLFINCHLQAHDEGLERRNEQWNKLHRKFVLLKDIDDGMTAVCMPKKMPKLGKLGGESEISMEHFDTVIWLGDFNYRINTSSKAMVQELMKNDQYEVLDSTDQFNQERRIKRVGYGYSEGKINFAPTFKIEKGTDI